MKYIRKICITKILFLIKNFDVNYFLKILLNLLQNCFCFMFWSFGHEACEILTPQPGIKPTPPAPSQLVLEGKVLATGPPRNSLKILLKEG